jgi:hypothetical protein
MFERSEPVVESAPEPQRGSTGPTTRTVQSKLVVGRSDDPSEREADRIADDVVAILARSRPTASGTPPTPSPTRIRRSSALPVLGAGGGPVDAPTAGRIRAASIVHTVQQADRPRRVVRREYVADADIQRPVSGVFTQDTRVYTPDGKDAGFEAQKGQREKFVRAGKTILWLNVGGAEYYVPRYAVALDQLMPTTSPLFARDPSPADVKQGSLGDCYLLAALASVAKARPQFIREMMKDLGDRVAVRFYHVTQPGGEGQPFKFDPVLVTVDKSSLKSASGEDLHAKGSLWVQIIEKAYVASRIDPHSMLINELPKASYDVYEEGGTGWIAMRVILGADATSAPVFSGYDRGDSEQLPWGSNDRAAWNGRNYAGMASFPILNGDQALIDKWMTFITTVDAQKEGPLERLFNGRTEFKDAAKQDPYYDGDIRVEHFERMFKQEGLDDAVAKPMLAWLRRSGYYPTKRGRAKDAAPDEPAYSTTQLETYTLIDDSLRAGKAVQLKTKDVPMRSSKQEGAKGNAGEAMGQGIVGGHYYTVLGCDIDTTVIPGLKLRWVQVRNPWGRYGVEYDLDKNRKLVRKKVEEGSGVFWLELNDVTKHFKSVHLGSIPTA